MDAEHILENMRHLHSDATKETLGVLSKLQETSAIVEALAKQVVAINKVGENDGLRKDIANKLESMRLTLIQINKYEERIEKASRESAVTEAENILRPVLNRLNNVESSLKTVADKEISIVLSPLSVKLQTALEQMVKANTNNSEILNNISAVNSEISERSTKLDNAFIWAFSGGIGLFLIGLMIGFFLGHK